MHIYSALISSLASFVKFISATLISFLCRLGYGNQKADVALVLAQVILELLGLLLFQRSGGTSLLAAVGENVSVAVKTNIYAFTLHAHVV